MLDLDNFLLKPPINKKILVLGHPRCGSGFAADLINSFGLNIGHELMGKDGISSWMFAVDSQQCPFGPGYAKNNYLVKFSSTILHIRNPFDAIPSIIVENRIQQSFSFRDFYIRKNFGKSLIDLKSEIDKAAYSYLAWNILCLTKKPDIFFRIEDEHEKVKIFLYKKGILKNESAEPTLRLDPKNTAEQHFKKGKQTLSDEDLYKTDLVIMKKPKLSHDSYNKISIPLKIKIIEFCNCFGYQVPSWFSV